MDALMHLKESLADRYDIKREIGAGGMATVYLAQDLRHDRPVALKLLNPELGAVLGVERFLAEIRVTANLQHPNLLPLFDSGAADGLLYYVMPFVEGESLRSRLTREKQLPVDEAVRMTVAIANALDYAHSHGVIHRDLKPENILLQAGQPVIADFGIALAVSNAGGSRITQTGLSLGTPQYMSPEQATGDRVIDGRSDIYSLGAVAYEMLTGDAPHTGSTSQAIIARMLTEKPRSMRASRGAIPEHVEDAVQHALEKLPADRFSSARQFAEALHGHGGVGTTGVYTSVQRDARGRKGVWWKRRLRDPVTIGLGAIAVAAVAYALAGARATPAPQRPVRFVIAMPDSLRPVVNYPWPAAISPDGSVVVYAAVGEHSEPMFYALRTDQLDARPIPGTTGAWEPSFSPDGQWFLFQDEGKIRKVRLDGSASIAIADGGSANGGDWTTRDELVLGSDGTKHGLSKVSVAGGDLLEFVKPDSARGETDYLWPIGFPDGKRAVFTVWTASLATASLATVSMEGGEVSRLGIKAIRPLAVIDRTLVFLQADGAVMAVELDRSGRKIDGPPIPVHDPVTVVAGNNGNSGIFVSQGGALVTSRGGTRSQVSWVARDGSYKTVSKESRAFTTPRLSPDERRFAVVTDERDKSDIWIYDMDSETFSRLTSTGAAASPVWSADGSRIFYVGLGGKERYAIWSQLADGGSPPEKIVDTNLTSAVVVAPDGRSMIYTTYSNNNTWDLFRVRLDPTPVIEPYLAGTANETSAAFSPDGRWVAMVSDESGRDEVYVRSYPNPSARVQISAGGGLEPVWSRDGTRLFYRSGRLRLSVKLSTTPTVRLLSRDTAMVQGGAILDGGIRPGYDISRDGRILGLVSNKDDYQLVVVPNWRVELEQRLATAGRR
jgi:eukaryotic-like serine/threonine-protein kinase